jgi:hypothetical protein
LEFLLLLRGITVSTELVRRACMSRGARTLSPIDDEGEIMRGICDCLFSAEYRCGVDKVAGGEHIDGFVISTALPMDESR